MNILVVPDSFKEAATSMEVADAIEAGILNILPQANVLKIPVADGGEGSLEALNQALAGVWKQVEVEDPLGRTILTKYLLTDKTAYIELAQASGLQLLSEQEKNGSKTTTLGTGHTIKEAIKRGAKEIVLCIGGSATNDAGFGIAWALGYQFLDKEGSNFLPTGETLNKIEIIRAPGDIQTLKEVKWTILCDVDNPFTGPEGAVYTYGPQKGIREKDLAQVEANMIYVQSLLEAQFGGSLNGIPGAGAAGGVGGGLHMLFNAQLESGIAFLIDRLDLNVRAKNTDLIITGEGRIDFQTFHGKTIDGLINLATKYDKPILALCGKLECPASICKENGLTAAFSILSNTDSIEKAMQNTLINLEETTQHIISTILPFYERS